MKRYYKKPAVIIGVTGGFGTGKSYVSGIFKSLGAKVIDADKIAHSAIRKTTAPYGKIKAAFGSRALDKNKNIDKKILAEMVFGDRALLKKLNSIIHPWVIRAIKAEIRNAPSGRVVVLDAPLLIEAGLRGIVDKLIVVTCPRDEQIRRCRKKFGLSEREVLGRIGSQIPLRDKVKMADYRINNGAARVETKKRAEKIWRQIVWR